MKKVFVFALVLTLALSACASPATQAPAAATTEAPVVATEPPQTEAAPTEAPAASKALFKIVKADGSSFDVTLDAVKTLALAQITVDGKVQEGPKLMDILALAGVTDFVEVTIEGSSAPCTLMREQVDDNTILDFSNRGTMKLATTYIPKADWTKDITQITVK